MKQKKFRQQITLEEMNDEIIRELSVRKRVYPRWIQDGKIKKETADFRCLVFEAIMFKLYEEIKATSPQKGLFTDEECEICGESDINKCFCYGDNDEQK
jgi:hypothetical protein